MKDLIKPRTIIALMMYSTFCYLAIKGQIESDAVLAIVSALATFYYSERSKKNDKNIDNSNNV